MTHSTPPNSSPAAVSASSDALAAALSATEQGIVTLERMQQQTAELHRQYLEGQLVAQRCVQQLLEQQQLLLSGSPSMPVQLPAPQGEARRPAVMPVMEVAPSPPPERTPELKRRARRAAADAGASF